MSTPYDLITLAQAQADLAQSLPSDLTALSQCVSGASYAIRRWTGRDFVALSRDECYDSRGYSSFFLRQFPVVGPLARLAINPTTVLTVTNGDNATNQRALASLATMGDLDSGLTVVGLSLRRWASGVLTSDGLFFGRPPGNTGFSASAGAGGSLAAGTYLASYSLVGTGGESVPCPDLAVTVAASGSVAFTLPSLPANATGFNVYLSTAGGGAGTETRQNGGTPVGSGGTFTATGLAAGASPAAATNLTLQAVAAAVAALGNGWTAAVRPGYALWASADLRAIQGGSNALSGNGAAFQIHVTDVDNFSVNERTGEVRMSNVAYDPVFSMMNATGGLLGTFPPGFQTIRAAYTAGFPTVPYDVQQACLVTVRDWITDLQKVRVFKTETFRDYSYTFPDRDDYGLSSQVKGLLAQYRAYRRS